jgi:hypothetical protein
MQITIRPDLVAPLEAQSKEEDRSPTKIVNRLLADSMESRAQEREGNEKMQAVTKPRKEKP